MILLTGATGKIGSALAKQLAGRNYRTRALVRSPDRASGLRRIGIDIAEGDLASPDSLDGAMEGVTTLFLLTRVGPGMVELEVNAIEAASRAGIELIVKLSAPGAHPQAHLGIGRWHGEIEEHLTASGIAHTLLRPSYFMQNFLEFAPEIHSHGSISAPAGDARINMVDVRDIAAVAATALTERGHDGLEYHLSGPEAISFEEAAEALSEALERPVRYVDVSPEEYRGILAARHVPEWFVEDSLGIFKALSSGRASRVLTTAADVGSVPAIPFSDFVRDHADAFRHLPTQ